jgi:branched-chain amino acid transport system permease protein
MVVTNAIVQGILLGGLYALFACGLSLMFGVMNVVNLAHGDLSILAAFGALALVDSLHFAPFVTLLIVVPAMAALGYLMQRGVLQRSLQVGALAPLLVTFGISIILQNGLQEVFSADNRALNIGSLATASLRITDQLSVGWFSLLVFGVGVTVLVALQLFLSRTSTGRAMRATSDDQEAAQLMGIDNRHIYSLATAIAFATVSVAGIFLGMRTSFTPTAGPALLIFAFEAVIIGGLGSLWGTLLGGVALGVAQTVGAQVFSPAYGILTGHLVFLAVLALRPQGFLPKAVTA